ERVRPSVEARERDQVPAVVAEDSRERSPIPGAEVAEVDLWHEGAGQIVPAIEPEERPLEARQPAIRGAPTPEGARDGIKVLVRKLRAPPTRPGEEIARLEEGQVERTPVERDQFLGRLDRLAYRMEERGLRPEVPQEVLGHAESARRRPGRQPD